MVTSDENPYRLHKDIQRRWIAGVCAGIAACLNTNLGLVRFLAVLALGFFFVPTVLVYIVLAVVLRPRPRLAVPDRAEAAFWRGVADDPPRTIQALRDNFHGFERRLARMEAFVTSPEFDLRQRFRDLGA
jgi:phage shock protein C